MTLLFSKTYFPPNQASKVGKLYIEWLKDNPPDNSIGKTICIGVTSNEGGDIMVIGITDIAKGKEKEALMLNTRQNLFMTAGIEGFKYKTNIILNFIEAYKIIGMDAPEV
ncbi:hypothetical protein LCGC14_2459590 [marine sediment metagenome]|uniref:Uncharacterized protein n=1 Tax=marine sediment metagenome TaxID=412755 RepID=A0A0F9BDK8_9ZZZZ